MVPIIIFAFNRPKSFQDTIESLKNNKESQNSLLFIYVDGPRKNNIEDLKNIKEVQRLASNISGFKNVYLKFSETNNGLAKSIISGVSEVIEKYGSVIVLEDDLIVQPNFLSFMNQGLGKYENNKDVFSICGYTNKIKIPSNYPFDSYFCTRSSSWGWATWKDRWKTIEWSFENWSEWVKYKKEFNRWGGSDCFSMLKGCKEGRNKSWAIRFCFSQFLQNKLSVFPVKSLVKNDGFDGMGTNCKGYSRFKYDLMSPSIDFFS